MPAVRCDICLYRRRRDVAVIVYLLVTFVTLYLVLIIYDYRVMSSDPFGSLSEAKKRAVQLANEWYREDGIEAFGKYAFETYEESREYLCSDAYIESEDAINIFVEEVFVSVLEQSGFWAALVFRNRLQFFSLHFTQASNIQNDIMINISTLKRGQTSYLR